MDLLTAAIQAWQALLRREPGSVPGGMEACEALRAAIAQARPDLSQIDLRQIADGTLRINPDGSLEMPPAEEAA